MKFIRYFFYLAGNWNVSIALHIIRKEIKGEKKYRIETSGFDDLHNIDEKGIDISHATVYMPVSYDILEHFFKKLSIENFNHLIDIGCGKGRAMCVAAAFGVKKISGIDFSPLLINAAKANLLKTKEKIPSFSYKLINNDAFYFEIEQDVDCIFMFNPFDEVIMSGILTNIEKSLSLKPRNITVIYINPVQKHLFTAYGYIEKYHYQKMHYLEGSIFEKNVRKN